MCTCNVVGNAVPWLILKWIILKPFVQKSKLIFHVKHLLFMIKGPIFLKNRHFIIPEWFNKLIYGIKKPASVAQLDAPSDWRPGGRGFNPRRGRQHSFVEIDHEIFSTVILSLPLIQEGQLLVSGERMCTILVNGLED